MSFSDHKITQFAHKIADLPDDPQIPAAELKSRFDACPEELRQSLNAVCDDAARLDARVAGIVAETFGDTIPKSMLSDELQDEIDAKATQTALAAEAAAREATDTEVAKKCEVIVGVYEGDGTNNRIISLNQTPKMVFVLRDGYNWEYNGYRHGGMVVTGNNGDALKIVENGFQVTNDPVFRMNYITGTTKYRYFYLALI